MNPLKPIAAALLAVLAGPVSQPPAGTDLMTVLLVEHLELQAQPATGPTGAIDPVTVKAKLGDPVTVWYVTMTVDAWGVQPANGPAVLKPLEIAATGYFVATQPDWITIARRREIRTDGQVYYADLLTIPRRNITTGLILQPGPAAVFP